MQALELAHPFDAHSRPEAVVQGLIFRMTASTAEVVALRRARLQHWRSRALALADREAALHAAMDPDVGHIMRDKKLLLFKEMLADVGFPSTDALIEHLGRASPWWARFR